MLKIFSFCLFSGLLNSLLAVAPICPNNQKAIPGVENTGTEACTPGSVTGKCLVTSFKVASGSLFCEYHCTGSAENSPGNQNRCKTKGAETTAGSCLPSSTNYTGEITHRISPVPSKLDGGSCPAGVLPKNWTAVPGEVTPAKFAWQCCEIPR